MNSTLGNHTQFITYSLTFTKSYSKISCVAEVYPLHILFAYLLVLCGALALLSRVVPVLLPYHVWFGRFFMIFMYWAMASSLLIHNNGLPLPIIIFFIFMLVSLSIGWVVIKIHSSRTDQAVFERLDALSSQPTSSFSQLYKEEKEKYVSSKSFKERLISWKALHGFLMAFAWYQMLGRTMVTNPVPGPGCWTYPAYKSDDGIAVFVPEVDPDYAFQNSEGTFVALVSVPAILLFIGIGITFSWWGGRKVNNVNNKS
eukprot:TRINITY_DN1776_c0_g1_i1.p1 TRINITY_DN1776_c0_g1~~TRINITY_DN1776_c0_g1_i1.p1  ORF type:complete len:257 (+),score=38.76 TRINITY_DN1776_c0_g1_i1:73-843(+)